MELGRLQRRLQAATAPDRDIDRDLAVATGQLHVGDGGRLYRIDADGGHVYGGDGDDILIRKYTASLEAALGLVERALPGWCWSVVKNRRSTEDAPPSLNYSAEVVPPIRSAEDTAESVGITAPLAVLAALLRAILAQKRIRHNARDGSSQQNQNPQVKP